MKLKIKESLLIGGLALASAFMLNGANVHAGASSLPKSIQNRYYLGDNNECLYEYHFGKNNLKYANYMTGRSYNYYRFRKLNHGWIKATGRREPFERFKNLNTHQIKATVGKRHRYINMKRYSGKFIHSDDNMESMAREAVSKDFMNTRKYYARVTPKAKVLRWFAKHTYKMPRIHYVNYSDFSYRQYRPAFFNWNTLHKVPLVKTYRQALLLARSNRRFAKYYPYYAAVISNPDAKMSAKYVKKLNKRTTIYKIKYRHHYYYYTDKVPLSDDDLSYKGSNIIASSIDYDPNNDKDTPVPDQLFTVFKPTVASIIINKKYKSRIDNPKITKDWEQWLPVGASTDTNDFILHNGEWHETPASYDEPAYMQYAGNNYEPNYMDEND